MLPTFSHCEFVDNFFFLFIIYHKFKVILPSKQHFCVKLFRYLHNFCIQKEYLHKINHKKIGLKKKLLHLLPSHC